MANHKFFYGSEHLAYIYEVRKKGMTWQQVADSFNEKFDMCQSKDAIRQRYQFHEAGTDEAVDVKILQNLRTARKQNHKTHREASLALDALTSRDTFLEEIQDLIHKLPKLKPQVIPQISSAGKKRSTLEILLSDIHYGKKTETVDLQVIRTRVRQFTAAVLFKIKKELETYDINEVVVALLGDIIESATMHGPESLVGCEFGNAKQMAVAIESLYMDFFVPLCALSAKTGFKITVVCVPGNHDRTSKAKTYHNPGEEMLSYTIYKTLELLCNRQGVVAEFIIPKKSYAIYKIYGNYWLYEHGDKIPLSRVGTERHISNRSTQFGKQITGMRMGHYHELVMWGRGRCIVNESVVGEDSYSDELGYKSNPGQTIVQYVETSNRDNSFYQMFPVQLGTKNKT